MKLKDKILIITILWSVGCSQAQTDGNSQLTKKMDQYLQAYEKMGFSGAVLVAEKGQITLNKGYGIADESTNMRASENSIWGIGSITKPITAAAILKLEMQGKLSVKDPISKHIRGLDEDKGAITIHQLLTHSAGLREYSGRDAEAKSTEAFIEFMNEYPFKLPPGEQFAYSNVGYSVLGILIEEVSGQSYEQYITENLLDPAGMSSTGYNRPSWDRANFAKGYKLNGDEWGALFVKNHYENTKNISWNLKGNGGLLTTPIDMYRWSEALKGNKILSEEAKKKYYGEHVQAPGDFSPFNDQSPGYYGYGWGITKSSNFKTIIMHGGSNDVYEAGYMYYPEDDIFFFIASNRVKHPASVAILDFDKIIGNKPYELPELKEEAVLDETAAATYLGDYTFSDNSKAKVGRGDGDFSNWLTITPLDKEAYQKIVGKKMTLEEQEPFRVYAESILMMSKEDKPYSIFMDASFSAKKKKKKKRDTDTEVVYGGDDKTMQEVQLDFWTENELQLGAYQNHEFWAAVQVHERVWVYHKVNFEKGSRYITHYIGENELKSVRYREHITTLFLKPTKSGVKFREVNNEASYEFARNNKTQSINLELNIHKKKFSATK